MSVWKRLGWHGQQNVRWISELVLSVLRLYYKRFDRLRLFHKAKLRTYSSFLSPSLLFGPRSMLNGRVAEASNKYSLSIPQRPSPRYERSQKDEFVPLGVSFKDGGIIFEFEIVYGL